MRPTLILHIGLERTGTTSLQRFCVDHRRELRAASVCYPTNNLAFAGYNHAPLASCYLPEGVKDFTIASAPVRKKAVLDSLKRDIERSGAETVLISSEHFSAQLQSAQIKELAADFAEFDCKVAVVVRDHQARFFSCYATHIKSGGNATLAAFADATLASDCRQFRYAEIIADWREAFGESNLAAVAFDRRGDALRAILAKFAVREPNVPPLSSYRENPAYGPVIVEAFRRANEKAIARPSWSHTQGKWERLRIVRVLMELWLRTRSFDARAGAWRLDSERTARIEAQAEADRQWLLEQYDLPLPREESRSRDADIGRAKAEIESFLRWADALWRLSGVAEPIFAVAPIIAGMMRVARNAIHA